MDRLDIIRHMLGAIGESGVSNSNAQHPSVIAANAVIDAENTELQGIGWWFNYEGAIRLVPDENGEVQIPATAIKFKLANVGNMRPEDKRRYVRRGNRVYDTTNHTYTIQDTGLMYEFNVLLSVEDLPASAANYLKHKSALQMYINDDGDTFKTERMERDTSIAWQNLKAEQMSTLSVNALDNPTARALNSGAGIRGCNPNYIGG